VIDFLDVQCNVSLRLFRENCSQDSRGGFFKDIRKIHREIGNIIIVDVKDRYFSFNSSNSFKELKIKKSLILIPHFHLTNRIKRVNSRRAQTTAF